MCIRLMAICVIVAFCTAAGPQSSSSQPVKEICDKAYNVFTPDGQTQLGSYAIKAVENDKEIEITESISMESRGKKIAYTSKVVYSRSPLLPLRASAETQVDGKVCMTGKITFSEKTYSLECTGHLDKRTGEAITPPRDYVKKDQPIGEGVYVFQSALAALAPRLVPKEGTLKNVVFAEFPDDVGAPELVNFKRDYKIERKAKDDGSYDISLFGPHSESPIGQVRFGKDNQLIEAMSFGKVKMVEVEK